MKRIAFYTHFDMHDIVDTYVIMQLKALKKHINEIIFISHANISKLEQKKVKPYCHEIIVCKNEGFDFGAWKVGLLKYGKEYLAKFDETLLLNDSCYGPIDSFDDLFATMEKRKCDFWGITDHTGHKYKVKKGKNQYHLQSYFVALRKPVILSDIFWNFFINLKPVAKIEKAVVNYEIEFSSVLQKAKFKPCAYIENKTLGQIDLNYSVFKPMPLVIKYKLPLIKRKVFEHAMPDIRQQVIDYVSKKNMNLYNHMKSHMERVLSPQDQIISLDKFKILQSTLNNNFANNFKIAVQLHLYYEDLMEEFLDYLNNMPVTFDLYISTATSRKKELINNFFNKNPPKNMKKMQIKVTPNRGRELFAIFVSFAKELQKYDLVCKLHSKKSPHNVETENWRTFLLDSLVGSEATVLSILHEFQQNPRLGILTPPLYYMIYNLTGLNSDLWGLNLHNTENLLRKLNVSVHKLGNVPVAAWGSMFWFRPKALKPLFDYKFKINEFPKQWNVDGLLPHAIERSIIMVALESNYDFQLALSEKILIREYLNLHYYDIDNIPKLPKQKFIYHARSLYCISRNWFIKRFPFISKIFRPEK